MCCIFVDSENVGTKWLDLCESCQKNDKIFVFFTVASKNISLGEVRKVLESECQVSLIECVVGKNALDFQLGTEVGYRIGLMTEGTEDLNVIIYSNDSGYDAVVHYWKERGVDIVRQKTDDESSGNEKTIPSTVPAVPSRSKVLDMPSHPKAAGGSPKPVNASLNECKEAYKKLLSERGGCNRQQSIALAGTFANRFKSLPHANASALFAEADARCKSVLGKKQYKKVASKLVPVVKKITQEGPLPR